MQIFRLLFAQVKIHQISHVIFQTKSHFFVKFWMTVQCDERLLFCTFFAETVHDLDKMSHQSIQTFDCSRKISSNLYFDKLLKV